jgi:hypothetical protein
MVEKACTQDHWRRRKDYFEAGTGTEFPNHWLQAKEAVASDHSRLPNSTEREFPTFYRFRRFITELTITPNGPYPEPYESNSLSRILYLADCGGRREGGTGDNNFIREVQVQIISGAPDILTELFVVLLSPSRQMLGYHLKLKHGRFLPHSFQVFIHYHPNIRRRTYNLSYWQRR